MQHDADAYLVEYDDGERAIIDGYDWTGWETGHTTLAALECVRSYDHGARTAEELDMDRCAEGAAYVMSPLLALMLPAGAPWHPGLANELAMTYIVDEYGLTRSDYSGLWHADDPDDAQWLHELWDYQVEPALHDAGYIVETSGECGMTWIYRQISDGSE